MCARSFYVSDGQGRGAVNASADVFRTYSRYLAHRYMPKSFSDGSMDGQCICCTRTCCLMRKNVEFSDKDGLLISTIRMGARKKHGMLVPQAGGILRILHRHPLRCTHGAVSHKHDRESWLECTRIRRTRLATHLSRCYKLSSPNEADVLQMMGTTGRLSALCNTMLKHRYVSQTDCMLSFATEQEWL